MFRSISFLLMVFFIYCSTVPITGRRQLNIIPTQTLLSMSLQEYQSFMQSNRVSTNQSQQNMVRQVGGRLQAAVERYFRENKMGGELKNFRWEFNLVENSEVNAWCMPGGKVVVYTGILSLTEDETGLAVVMGHEIAHAVAKHGNERMSQGLLTQLGGMALEVALQSKPQETRQLWMAAFGLGAQVGMLLPFSRLHEYEADELGTIFMAMASYNPQRAISFWEKMSQLGGSNPPEFISTHPSDSKRVANLKKMMPKIQKYYRP